MSVLKFYNPTTPGRRGLVLIDRSSLWKGGPVKFLSKGISKTGGRNSDGRITSPHRGGGHRKVLRDVDFNRRSFLDITGIVERIEYDPNRTSYIALIRYSNDKFSYILCPNNVSIGDIILSSNNNISIKPGNCMPLSRIPVGVDIHNIEMKPGKGGQIARSAGSCARIVGIDGDQIVIRLSSGEMKNFHSMCFATIGSLSNSDNKNISIGKAGRSRWMGIKPRVRGVAMNPVDHPLGGGEGKTSGGRVPCNKNGLRKGTKTRSVKKPALKKPINKR